MLLAFLAPTTYMLYMFPYVPWLAGPGSGTTGHHLERFPPHLLATEGGSGSLIIDEKTFLWEELAASKYFYKSTFVFFL